MAVQLDPKPADGPLNGSAPFALIDVTTTRGGTIVAVITEPGKPTVEVLRGTLLPGRNRQRIVLPRRLPAGAKLQVLINEAGSPSQLVTYQFA